MSIQELYTNIKRLFRTPDMPLVGILILTALSSFGLGRYSIEDGAPESVIQATSQSVAVVQASPEPSPAVTPRTELRTEAAPTQAVATGVTEGAYVASKSGTKYHLPWCGGAKQIKEENKVWFKTKAEAEAAGYTPAANCKGI